MAGKELNWDDLRYFLSAVRAGTLAEHVEQAVAAVRDQVSARRARVRLAVPSGFTTLFTSRVAALREEHPKLSLELVSGARPADLKKGEADLAVRLGTIADKELVARKLCESGWALYAADTYLARRGVPRELVDLSGHDIHRLRSQPGAGTPSRPFHSCTGGRQSSREVRAVIQMVADVMRDNADRIQGTGDAQADELPTLARASKLRKA